MLLRVTTADGCTRKIVNLTSTKSGLSTSAGSVSFWPVFFKEAAHEEGVHPQSTRVLFLGLPDSGE